MSKVSISGDQNGSANFTIKAPGTSTDRTLTLPDEAGSVLTDASDIEPQVKTATNATGSAPIYATRAWANFDSSSGIVIRDSGNISSINDLATGRFRVNFATNMPDNDYAVVFGGAMRADGSSNASILQIHYIGGGDVIGGGSGLSFYATNGFDMNMKNVDAPELRDTVLATFAVLR